ncbi:PREDICTED: uncharacterized protein LOC104594973 [Nelumbo nucifera]|uniref:Uncharacterized protein n=2 Tax=Nelumbo nucifera TaxID=4432 RepID=A0A822Y1L4_NELNU|nr:PREDICTED: uncharacterized protein LOC104594973 [Nelumbo nucifera]DAD25873.1 TPA_asm: hypothetical protein HUJ06_027341 [Nelumbo nucifera]
MSFVAPREYEFSCSNRPAYPSYFRFHVNKRKNHHSYTSHSHQHHQDDAATIKAVQKMLEMLSNDVILEPSPLVNLPGFGKSPMVRQLRITDSPFPLRSTDEDSHVEKAAEEFIEKFYKDLKL